MAFSATDAAFEGFRVVRRRPLAVVFWALFYAVVMVAAFALMGPTLISFVTATEQLENSTATPTLEDFAPIFQMMGVLFAVLMPLGLVAGAMIYAAVARAVLRPGEGAFGYLRLGMDEFRVLVVSVALFVVFGLVMVVLSGVVGAVIGMTVATETPALWLLVVLVILAATALFIWLSVRLSLAIPITVAERRIAVFDSFALTKGRFWPLLGMALLAWVMSLVVSILGSLVAMPVQLATGGLDGLSAYADESLPVILEAVWPAIAAWIVVNAIMYALQVAVVYAPFSAAYRGIKGVQPDAEAFE